ncbi:Platelet-activating factor acetylhydrolase, partial [Rhizoclosmatium hyalinum]
MGNLASRGFVVLCVEHRDGSACGSGRGNYSETIPHIRNPHPEGPAAVSFRYEQLSQRVQEVKEAFQLLVALNEGKPMRNLLGSEFPLLQGRLDLAHTVIMGHSYGGATTLSVLQQHDNPFSCGISMDPWMYPIRDFSGISTPMLSIQCERFHWRKNLDDILKIWNNPASSPLNQFAVVKDTKHNDVSDFILVLPRLMGKFLQSGERDLESVYDLYDRVIISYLQQLWRLDDESLLKVDVESLTGCGDVSFGDEAFKLLLPPYPGPYSVGIAPFEIAPDGENAFGVMGSLFYPADLSQVKAPVKSKWLLGPSKLYAVGFGTYAGLPKRFNETVLSWYLDSAKIPSILSPPVAPTSTLSGHIPVVVFCHGLAGNQTSYSQFCGSLASKGMIVLAIEHRDGSTTSARNNYQDKIEYVRPPPGSEEILFRQNQLVQRVAEVKGAVKLLHQINDGRDIHNLLGHRLPSLQGRLDLDHPILMGHSFGGATAIGVLQE